MKQEIISLLITNVVLSWNEKLIKFVSFTAMLFQSVQSGIGCGIALKLGNISLLRLTVTSVQNLDTF